MSFRLGWVCALAWLVGCGAKPQAQAPTPATIEPTTIVAEAPPDLSPVTRPVDVVAVGHLSRPRLFVETLAKWSSAPVSVEALVPSEARGLASAVLWEAPVDLVLALDPFGEGTVPPPLFVASIGVKSLEAGLSVADQMQLPTRKLAPGVYRVGDFPDTSCALAASLGPAPARLVCGRAAKDVDTLLPYATRGLPSEPQTGADFELSLNAKPLQDRYGAKIGALKLLAGVAMREVALDTPRFDRALSDGIYGGIDEVINLFADLDQIRIEARLDASRNVLLTSAELRLRGSSSWTAGTIAATKPVPIPATLTRLPLGTAWAGYTGPQPADRYTALNHTLVDLADGFLEHEKLPEATRKKVRRAMEPWLLTIPENFAFAVPSSQIGADGDTHLHPDTSISRISEPSTRILTAYGDLLGLINDAPLKKWVQSKGQLDKKAWPTLSKRSLKIPGFKVPATVFEVSVDGKALASLSPSMRKALDNAFPQAAQDRLGTFTFLVQPDGAFTYVATGENAAEIGRVLGEHRKNEPGAFFARPARSDLVTSAGFFTLAYLARTFERSANLPEVRRALTIAPHHGATPIPFSTTTGPGSARFDLELPADLFGDLSAMAASAGGPLKDALEKRSSRSRPVQPSASGQPCNCPPGDALCSCL